MGIEHFHCTGCNQELELNTTCHTNTRKEFVCVMCSIHKRPYDLIKKEVVKEGRGRNHPIGCKVYKMWGIQ